ncbi:MAG: FAD-dependent oxidoreductase [Burkholderiales bacterium]|nr:MAG: FAD-dependent oxidoreductase [Burkholderiales bacterium]
MGEPLRIAVVGGGIAGLGAAHRLAARHRVTLFEAADYVGGHTNTVDATVGGITHPVDTGFLVYNERTYPNLIALFEALGVPTAASEMSFSVSVGPHDFEWCGSDVASLFAQPSNALSPRFWSMLRDILRFNRQATALARDASRADDAAVPLAAWLDANGYGRPFRDGYLLPMAAAIWSCPTSTMLAFPVGSFARFCDNHGLLQVANRPRWFTVRGGARQYVEKIVAGLDDVRTRTPVRGIQRTPLDPAHGGRDSVTVITDQGRETYDHVVLACHSDQSLGMLLDASGDEREILAAVPYQPNRAYLHTDLALMPKRRRAWAAWNYLSAGSFDGTADRSAVAADADAPSVAVTYWLNRLQPLPFAEPVLVTLNPLTPPRDETVLATFDYSHPVFDGGAIAAQRRLPAIQGVRNTWYAGAWTGWGFHEDGLKSGLAVAGALLAPREARRDAPPTASVLAAA